MISSSQCARHFLRPPTSSGRRGRRPAWAALSSADGDAASFSGPSCSISDFLRYRSCEGRGGAVELQTAVVSYRKQFPCSLLNPFLQVDLVSTIHIADEEYFETLQRVLTNYDCVLYEMVTSRSSLLNRKNFSSSRKLKDQQSRGFNIIGFIQKQMANILSLKFQLDYLDYDDEKWQHADLDYETFKQLQQERGESFFTFARDMTLKSSKAFLQPVFIPDGLDFWRSKLLWASRVLPMPLVGLLIISGVCSPPVDRQADKFPELEALSRFDFAAALKIVLARQLSSEFTGLTASPDENSVIIGERNRVALTELKRAIQAGHKRIAVLYGGGHMPDLARRLRDELEMVPSEVHWISAWTIRRRELNSTAFPILKTLAELSGWPLNRYQTLALLMFSGFLALDLWLWELFVGEAVNWASWAASEINHVNAGL